MTQAGMLGASLSSATQDACFEVCGDANPYGVRHARRLRLDHRKTIATTIGSLSDVTGILINLDQLGPLTNVLIVFALSYFATHLLNCSDANSSDSFSNGNALRGNAQECPIPGCGEASSLRVGQADRGEGCIQQVRLTVGRSKGEHFGFCGVEPERIASTSKFSRCSQGASRSIDPGVKDIRRFGVRRSADFDEVHLNGYWLGADSGKFAAHSSGINSQPRQICYPTEHENQAPEKGNCAVEQESDAPGCADMLRRRRIVANPEGGVLIGFLENRQQLDVPRVATL
jgi:hypothetical protein